MPYRPAVCVSSEDSAFFLCWLSWDEACDLDFGFFEFLEVDGACLEEDEELFLAAADPSLLLPWGPCLLE